MKYSAEPFTGADAKNRAEQFNHYGGDAMDKFEIRELLRYAYTGFLCAFVAAVVDGDETEKLVRCLGNVLAPLAAVSFGAVVYLVFKSLVGDLFLAWLVHWIHAKAEDLFKRTPTRCKVRFLQNLFKVPNSQGLAAFALVRDQLLDKHIRERIHLQHSEGYLLYLTAFVCGAAGLISCARSQAAEAQSNVCTGLGIMALVTFIAAVRHDIVLCRDERAQISVLDQDKLKKTLRKGGFGPEKDDGAANDPEDTA